MRVTLTWRTPVEDQLRRVDNVTAGYYLGGAFLVAQMVKHLPTMQETQVQSLGQEDPLEKGMATHSSVLARRIPWIKELGGLQACDQKERGRKSEKEKRGAREEGNRRRER